MTKSQLITIVAKKAYLTKRAANDAVEALFEEVKRSLKKGEEVVISGFGTFDVGEVQDKQVVPFGHEGQRQTVKRHNVVNFRSGKPLKKMIW